MADCPQCGEPRPADAPDGICPRCVISLGMSDDPDSPRTETGGRGQRFVAPRPADLAVHFPQLDILELLGQGGMGAVYKARQKSLDRVVALKILPPEVGRDPAFAERFTREAKALARLAHSNIVIVFEFGQANDYYYFVMEFVDGVTLRETMETGQLSANEALAIVPQICEALQYAHDEGVVHRDIKPENVLIDRRGRVRIADFGLAKLLGRETDDITLTGTRQVMGTLHYMAPEQIERPTTVDHRADIYSLGVVFYELLTGELPIGRFDPPSVKAHVNSRLDDIVLRALAKEPDRRYQKVSEVKTAVETMEPDNPERPPIVEGPRAGSPLRVPFTIGDVYGGLAKAEGMARFDGAQIQLKFEVKDDVLGVVKSGMKTVTVGLAEIISAEFTQGVFSDKLCFQTEDLESISNVPGIQRGRAMLKTSKQDRQAAREFVRAVTSGLRGGYREPVVAATRQVTALTLDEARRAVAGPGSGLIIAGILDVVAAIIPLFIIALYFGLRPVQQVEVTPGVVSAPTSLLALLQSDEATESADVASEASVDGDSVEVAGNSMRNTVLTWIVYIPTTMIQLSVGVLLIIGGVHMRRLRHRGLAMTVSTLALLPCHAGFVVGLPTGIWSLIILGQSDIRDAFREATMWASDSKGKPDAGKRSIAVDATSGGLLILLLTLAVMCALGVIGLVMLVA